MIQSETGNPLPLLSYVCAFPPASVTSTLKDEIDVSTGRSAVKA